MPSRDDVARRRDRVRELTDAGASQRSIARMLSVSPRTVRRDLADEPENRPSTAQLSWPLVVDAWLSFRARACREPKTVDWNASRAWHKGGESARIYEEGWVGPDGQHRAWPDPSRDVRPGGWSALERAGRAKSRRLVAIGRPYVLRPLPVAKRGLGTWTAFARSSRRESGPRVLDEDLAKHYDEPTSPLQTTRGPAWRPLRLLHGLAVLGSARSGKSTLLKGFADLDAGRGEPVVLLERGAIHESEEFGSVAGLLEGRRTSQQPLVLRGDENLRRRVIEEMRTIADSSPKPPLLFVDDAEDVIGDLVKALAHGPVGKLPVAAAWKFSTKEPPPACTFSPIPPDLALFWMLLSRMVLRLDDQDAYDFVHRQLWRGVDVERSVEDPHQGCFSPLSLEPNGFLGRICPTS